MSAPSVASTGVNAPRSSFGASVESLICVSKEDEVDNSPLPELGGRAACDLIWSGETPVVRQRRSRREQRQLDLDSVALFVEKVLTTEELQEWLSVSVMHNCLTAMDGLYNYPVCG